MTLDGKKIIVGVTGGIAAYKAAILVRLLIKQGATVKVIMTDAAKDFITPLTMATLSKNDVLSDFYHADSGKWNSHVELGLWADAMIIAPATANSIAKMANGISDNLLITTYLSARCPVFIAVAMDLDMYHHQSSVANLDKLRSYGNHIIEAAHGELASGLVGDGRMQEPETIVERVEQFFASQAAIANKLQGKTVLVTSGPTYEAIDPVRFIGNHSSGKMGAAIALCLAQHGANVILVSGPNAVTAKHPNISNISVTSAAEMYDAATSIFASAHVAIMAAAVADFAPEVVAEQKIKRTGDELVIRFKPTQDIAAQLGKTKKAGQLLVGFALETNDEEKNALGKMERKNLDLIVLNSLNDKGAGFRHDTNRVTIIDRTGNIQRHELKSKNEVAADIVAAIADLLS